MSESISQRRATALKCYIATVPLRDILWYCIVSIFLEINDVAMMERAFTNKSFYTFKDQKCERQGLFMDVDWDTAGVPLTVSKAEQIEWLNMRNIRIYNVRCVNLRNDTFERLLQTSRKLLHSIDLSGCKEHVTTATLHLIAEYCDSKLKRVKLSGCDTVSNIAALTSKCQSIEHLDLQSMYRLTDADCMSIARDLPHLEVLDMSYCDKITVSGIRSLISKDLLKKISIAGCPRLNASALNTGPNPWIRLLKLNVARLHLDSAVFSSLLSRCVNLEEINIYGSYGVDDALLRSIASFCPKLKCLYTGDCLAGLVDVNGCLSQIAQSCPMLQALNLAFVSITDSTLKVFGKHCHHLRDLDFACCSAITDEGIEALVAGNPFLRDMRLYRCSYLTDRSVQALLTCTNLRSLDVQGCRMSAAVVNLVARKATVKLLISNYGEVNS